MCAMLYTVRDSDTSTAAHATLRLSRFNPIFHARQLPTRMLRVLDDDLQSLKVTCLRGLLLTVGALVVLSLKAVTSLAPGDRGCRLGR